MNLTQRLQTFQQVPDAELEAGFSWWERRKAEFNLGADESITKTVGHVLKKNEIRNRAKELNQEPLSREQFEEQFEGMEYIEGEYLEEAKLRWKYTIDRNANSIVASHSNMWANLATGIAGNTAQPADLALALFPSGLLVGGSKTAVTALRTGRSFARTKRAVSRIAKTDKAFKTGKIAERAAAGKSTLLPTFSTTARLSLGEQFTENGVVWAGSEYTGRDYGALDFGADIIFGSVLNTGMNVPAVMKANKNIRQYGKMKQTWP